MNVFGLLICVVVFCDGFVCLFCLLFCVCLLFLVRFDARCLRLLCCCRSLVVCLVVRLFVCVLFVGVFVC